MEYVAVAIIVLSSAADALRDAWMRSEGWWKRHAVKWVAFYTPLTFILVIHLPIVTWIPVAVASWIVWRLSLRHIGGKEWESMWFRWAKNFFNKNGG